MCKVLAITNMKKVKLDKKFLTAVKYEMYKKGDKDGFGYAVLGENGEIGGERTLTPEKFIPLESYQEKRIYNLPIVTKMKNNFGTLNRKNPKSFMAHGRWSTNTVNLENTHPFYNGDVALIHNGVVQNASSTKLDLKTNCDTEILLKYWERNGMADIEANVSGYYAMAILEKNGLMHIVKDDKADLHVTYSKTIESYIFATTPDIIESLCKEMKWKIEEIEAVNDNVYTTFNGNEVLTSEEIKPLGSFHKMTDRERTALGYVDEDDTQYYKNWLEKESTKWKGATEYSQRHSEKSVVPSHKEYYSRDQEFEGVDEDGVPSEEYVKSFLEDERTKDMLEEMEERRIIRRKA